MPVTRSMIAQHFELEEGVPGNHPAMAYYRCLHCEAQGTRTKYCFDFEDFQSEYPIVDDLLCHLSQAHGVQLRD